MVGALTNLCMHLLGVSSPLSMEECPTMLEEHLSNDDDDWDDEVRVCWCRSRSL